MCSIRPRWDRPRRVLCVRTCSLPSDRLRSGDRALASGVALLFGYFIIGHLAVATSDRPPQFGVGLATAMLVRLRCAHSRFALGTTSLPSPPPCALRLFGVSVCFVPPQFGVGLATEMMLRCGLRAIALRECRPPSHTPIRSSAFQGERMLRVRRSAALGSIATRRACSHVFSAVSSHRICFLLPVLRLAFAVKHKGGPPVFAKRLE